MEDKNMARIELNEERLDEVVGGAFHYYTNKAGQQKCVVDGVGSYYVTATAFENVAAHAADVTLSAQQVTDWALANGYFSTTPINQTSN